MSTPNSVKGTITSNTHITKDVSHITIKPEQRLEFTPGQFTMITINTPETKSRPYSIASAPWEEELSFCVKKVEGGTVSTELYNAQPGTTLTLSTPLGVFTIPEHTEAEHYAFIATGTGIAPFRSMIRTLFPQAFKGRGHNTQKKITLLFGARTKEDLLYKEEFEHLQREAENFTYYATLSREKKEGFLQGHVQEHLHLITQPENTLIFICGLTPMVRETKKALLNKGIPPTNIHTELYG